VSGDRQALPPDLRGELAAYHRDLGLRSEPYDVGYIIGWYKARLGLHATLYQGAGRRFAYRDPDSVREARLGHAHGQLDGQGRATPWWPTFARGTNAPPGPSLPLGAPVASQEPSRPSEGALWRMSVEADL
jgi:hypothetical protein